MESEEEEVIQGNISAKTEKKVCSENESTMLCLCCVSFFGACNLLSEGGSRVVIAHRRLQHLAAQFIVPPPGPAPTPAPAVLQLNRSVNNRQLPRHLFFGGPTPPFYITLARGPAASLHTCLPSFTCPPSQLSLYLALSLSLPSSRSLSLSLSLSFRFAARFSRFTAVNFC